ELVRDLWPGARARLSQDSVDFEDMSRQQIVPHNFDGICEWAYLYQNMRTHDYAHQYQLLYQPTDPTVHISQYTPVEVVIRFQGFLGAHDLRVLGNWNGYVSFLAYRATQKLTLCAGPLPGIFKPQFEACKNIEKLILRQLFGGEEGYISVGMCDNMETFLAMERRVFTKIYHRSSAPPSVLTVADDTTGQAALINDEWRVTEKLACGKRVHGGGVERCNPHTFSVGDFVDVAAKVEVGNVKVIHGRPSVAIQLKPNHIIQLCPASEISAVSQKDFVQAI
ncbi:hypothetical protein BV25DRAFT_1813589, partial [Artomyces pyxidatus]